MSVTIEGFTMKHHVFFFLLTVFFPMCAMDKYEQKLSKLIQRCILVNTYCPGTYDVKSLEEGKREFLQLSSIEKKQILKEAYNCVPRHIREIDGNVVFSWKHIHENKPTKNRICST